MSTICIIGLLGLSIKTTFVGWRGLTRFSQRKSKGSPHSAELFLSADLIYP
jgi:hypothetical protein